MLIPAFPYLFTLFFLIAVLLMYAENAETNIRHCRSLFHHCSQFFCQCAYASVFKRNLKPHFF
jgi:hypothetical protein